MTEGTLQRYFKRQAKLAGILWRKIKFEGQRGCPDVLIAKGKLSEIQKRQIKKLTDAGIEAHVIDTQKDIDDIIKNFPKE